MRNLTISLSFAMLLLATMSPAVIQAEAPRQWKALPVDESARDPSFAAFWKRFQQVVRRRDGQALLNMVHPDVYSLYGGPDEFMKSWEIGRSTGAVWIELDAISALGVALEGDYFWAPYYFIHWPAGAPDSAAVILGTGVVRSAPSSGSAAVPVSRYSVVEVLDWGWPADAQLETPARWQAAKKNRWLKILTPEGSAAYVEAVHARTSLEYRIAFSKEGNDWKLVVLSRGD